MGEKTALPVVQAATPPTMRVARVYSIQAAHRLPNTPPQHKCHRLHGHTYSVRVELTGRASHITGWVLDFGSIDVAWEQLIHSALDHRYLNEVEGLQNPTSEVLAVWIAERLHVHFRGIAGVRLTSVEVMENERSSALYVVPDA